MIVAMKCIFYIRLKAPKRGLLGQNNVSNWAVLLFPNFLWLWHALITSCRCISPSEGLQKLVQSPHSIQPVTKLCLAYICERNDYSQKFQNRICTIILVLKGGPSVGQHLTLLGQFFPGYSVTFLGSLVGFFYAFVIGFLIGAALGIVYNRIAKV